MRRTADRPTTAAAASIYTLAVFFLILGATSIVVGEHDAALAQPTLGETAASALLLVGGILLLVAAANLTGWCAVSRGRTAPARPATQPCWSRAS